jgi:crotonobetainyl-CoA:carnitine CoA-transferase CaiB-like acyl-CoA transferase
MTKPIKFADTPGPPPSPSPAFGQHSDEILASFGCSAQDIATLRERGIIR